MPSIIASGDYASTPMSGDALRIDTGVPYGASYYASFETLEKIKVLEEKVAKLENENISLRTAEYCNKDGSSKEWFNLRAMLDNMSSYAKHNSKKLIISDNARGLKNGFICPFSGKIWEISISLIKSHIQEMYISDGMATLIPDAFSSEEGKKLLLDVINSK